MNNEITVNGMNKETYIAWRMDAYKVSYCVAEQAWNRLAAPKKEISEEERFENMRNAYLY